MNLFKSIIGRRQFLCASAFSFIAPVFIKVSRALGFVFPGTAKTLDAQKANETKAIKGCVVYYSATGSTAKVAHAIRGGMESVIECDVFPIKKANPKEMSKYDVIALGTPIWYNRETINMDLFILDMPVMKGKLCIPFCTHGVGPNGFMYNISKAIFRRGMTIIGWADWYGSVFHVLHQPKPYYTDGHPDKVDLAEAEEFGRLMAERAQKIYDGQTDLIPEIPGQESDTIWRPMKMERPGAMADMMGTMGEAGAQAGSMPGGDGGREQDAIPSLGAPEVQADMPGGPQRIGIPDGGPGREIGRGDGMPSGREGSPPGGVGGGIGSTGHYPVIDLKNCIYPRCRACMDICVQNAIDLTRIKAQAYLADRADLLVKNACIQCKYPECQRACKYDAIIYESATTSHEIDMAKCTYPKCTLCIDYCPMNSIYVSEGKLIFHNNCEGCDVCYCICPTGAVSITNLEDTVHFGAGGRQFPGQASSDAGAEVQNPGQAGEGVSDGTPSGIPSGGHGDSRAQGMMAGATTLLPGETNEAMNNIGGSTANMTGKRVFRSLVKAEDIGKYYTAVLNVEHRPILEPRENDWPVMKDKKGNIIRNCYS